MSSSSKEGNGDRCPGGYIMHGKSLCGPSGNRCVDVCAFAYRGPYDLRRPAPTPDDASGLNPKETTP